MNAATFADLYARHYSTARAVAAFYGTPYDELDDVAQEVFARLWESQVEARDGGGGLVYVVTRNLLTDLARQRRREDQLGKYETALAMRGVLDDSSDDRLEVARLLARLDDARDRQIVLLLASGLDGVSIGRLYGLSKATVSRRSRIAYLVMRGINPKTLAHNGRAVNRGNIVKGLG